MDADPELNKANLSDSLLLRTLWAKLPPQGAGENVDLGPCKQLLRTFAKWHLQHLGASSTRLSVMHVHAFLLTGILQVGRPDASWRFHLGDLPAMTYQYPVYHDA